MYRKSKNRGFTLIEIIVVLIILGVLAALAIPAYFSWVNRSYGAKAFNLIRDIKMQTLACTTARSSDAGFDLQMSCLNPIRGRFTDTNYYILGLNSGGGTITQLHLERNDSSGDVLQFYFDLNGNVTLCRGYGNYAGLC